MYCLCSAATPPFLIAFGFAFSLPPAHRCSSAARMASRSPLTPSQPSSLSTALASPRMYSRYDSPPIVSDSAPASERCAPRRLAAYEWPPEMMPAGEDGGRGSVRGQWCLGGGGGRLRVAQVAVRSSGERSPRAL